MQSIMLNIIIAEYGYAQKLTGENPEVVCAEFSNLG